MAIRAEHIDGVANLPARTASKPPLTANPAFPWIVALWFAALLGIGSLVLPAPFLERASMATGLANVVPQAAPPLGFTAKVLLAVIGTLVGAVLGFLLARRIAAPHAERAMPRLPLNAAEDIGDTGIGAETEAEPPKGRRRALAIEDEERRSDFLDVVPLPGLASPVEDEAAQAEPIVYTAEPDRAEGFGDLELQKRQLFEPCPADADSPMELEPEVELTEEQPEEAHGTAQTGDAMAADMGEQRDLTALAAANGMTEAAAPSPGFYPSPAPIYRAELDPDPAPETRNTKESTMPEEPTVQTDQALLPGDDLAGEDAGEDHAEGLVQLVQRLGSTLEKHREWSARRAAQRAARHHVAADTTASQDEANSTAERAPLAREFDPAAAEEAAKAMAAYFGSPAASPTKRETSSVEAEAADEPVTGASTGQRFSPFGTTFDLSGFDPDNEDALEDGEDGAIADLAASLTLPLTRERKSAPRPAFDQPPAAPPSPDPQEDHAIEAPVVEDESVSEFGAEEVPSDPVEANPFRQDAAAFVRIEEPEPEDDIAEPAVQFPGQLRRASSARPFDPPATGHEAEAAQVSRPKPSNDDNERALREALMNLQRMGK
ncbi:hypothetical protein [Aurantiacibacter poecillastricola]|uniref:hypothetical protein n=1 Tax=Aurantiacibacter poecillastricola TaxID=3064385 RepID=UPI00273E59E3|nr:hypothetical protein [Aurantiacibacter sp. 219JJ12-13]MDP5260737.1 hypothetical protein [Aurantiacibacter sp. 219JJ12-13]